MMAFVVLSCADAGARARAFRACVRVCVRAVFSYAAKPLYDRRVCGVILIR